MSAFSQVWILCFVLVLSGHVCGGVYKVTYHVGVLRQPVAEKVVESGLECSSGHVLSPSQVLSSVQLGTLEVVVEPADASSSTETAQAGAVSVVSYLLQATVSKLIGWWFPDCPTVKEQAADYSYLTTTLAELGTPEDKLLVLPAMNYNNLISVYQHTFGDKSERTNEEIQRLLMQAAQMALVHYTYNDADYVTWFNQTPEELVDQAVRLWLLVKIWLIILANEDPGHQAIGLWEKLFLQEKYRHISFEKLYRETKDVVTLKAKQAKEKSALKKWLKKRLYSDTSPRVEPFNRQGQNITSVPVYFSVENYGRIVIVVRRSGKLYLITRHGQIITGSLDVLVNFLHDLLKDKKEHPLQLLESPKTQAVSGFLPD